MLSHNRRERTIAIGLAGLAGYVDALGFMTLGGYFIAFMSGNTTRLGVGGVRDIATALLPAAIIALFVVGVMLGTLIHHAIGRRQRVAVMALVTLLLLSAALAAEADGRWPAVLCMALAMGAVNTVFQRNGEVSLGVTYMTGALVKLGQRLTGVVLGGNRLAWVWYFLLWLALLTGTMAGSAAYLTFGLQGLWLAVAAALVICGLLWHWPVMPERRPMS